MNIAIINTPSCLSKLVVDFQNKKLIYFSENWVVLWFEKKLDIIYNIISWRVMSGL